MFVDRAAYVAIGLSDDNKMGKDSVIECVNEAGSIKAYASWTEAALGKFDAPRNVVRIYKSFLRLIQQSILLQVDFENINHEYMYICILFIHSPKILFDCWKEDMKMELFIVK